MWGAPTRRPTSTHPLAIALAGMSGCSAVSGFCAIVTPPTSRMAQSASAPSSGVPACGRKAPDTRTLRILMERGEAEELVRRRPKPSKLAKNDFYLILHSHVRRFK